MGRGREQLHVLNTKIYSDMTNADLPFFFLFRHVKQGAFNHTEFKKNFQNSEPSDTKSKATERPPERKNKLVNSSRAKYKFVHLMKLICKFIVNTQNAIRSCLLALIFDPTTLIEIAVYRIVYSLESHLFYFIKIRQSIKAYQKLIHSQLNDTDGG